MFDIREILEVVEEGNKEQAVKALGIFILEGLKSECELIKITLGLLADSDLDRRHEMMEGFMEVLEKKANTGMILAEELKKYV